MELSSQASINENLDDKKSMKSEHNNSSGTINHLSSVSKRKQLKHHNEELEKYLRRQQTENEFYRQDSFLKKFSTRSHLVNENNNASGLDLKDHHTPLAERKSKSSRFSCSSVGSPAIRQKRASLRRK